LLLFVILKKYLNYQNLDNYCECYAPQLNTLITKTPRPYAAVDIGWRTLEEVAGSTSKA
jgi:hypothetical protein